MLSHEKHVAHTQAKRRAALDAVRKRFADKELAEAAERATRLARREAIEELRRERERERREQLKLKIMNACGNTALLLDDVLALRPCRRISAVKAMLQHYWDQGIAVTAQMAIAAGCTQQDIEWVYHRLEYLKRDLAKNSD